MTVAKEPVTGESTKETVKTIAVRECRVMPVYSLLLVCVLPLQLHTRLRVQRAPGVPHALFGREINQRLGRLASRDLYGCLEIVIASAAKQSTLSLRGKMDCFAEPVIGRAFARPAGSQ
jgi:hypothetical protein